MCRLVGSRMGLWVCVGWWVGRFVFQLLDWLECLLVREPARAL